MTFKAIRVDKTDAGQDVALRRNGRKRIDGRRRDGARHPLDRQLQGRARAVGKSAIPRRFPMVLGIDLAGVVESSAHPGFRRRRRSIRQRLRPRRDPFRRLRRARAREGRLADEASRRAGRAPKAMAVGTAGYTAALSVDAIEAAGVTPAMGAGGRHRRGGRRRLGRDRAARQGGLERHRLDRPRQRGRLSEVARRERDRRSRDAIGAGQAARQGALGGGRRQRRLAYARQRAGADPLRRRHRRLRARRRHGLAGVGRAVHLARRQADRHRQRAMPDAAAARGLGAHRARPRPREARGDDDDGRRSPTCSKSAREFSPARCAGAWSSEIG